MSVQLPLLGLGGIAVMLAWAAPLAAHSQMPTFQTLAEHRGDGEPERRPAAAGPPANLQSGAFRSAVDVMWRQSPSFRRQCARLAAEPSLVVKLTTGDGRSGLRAWTEMSRTRGTLTLARVAILSPADTVELIAHELEHVIEQLDGYGPPGSSSRTQHAAGVAYESGRAAEAGRRVAREVRENRGRVVLAIPQREQPGGALDPASASVSASGRFIVFTSSARLAENDRNDAEDLYVLDVDSGKTTLESTRPGWPDRYRPILYPRISGDGRFIVFQAVVESGPEPTPWQVIVLDRRDSAARVASVDASGRPADGHCTQAAISADGTTVVFESQATNLGEGPDANGATADIYRVRLAGGPVSRVSVTSDGTQPAEGHSVTPSVSADGRHIAFTSTAALDCHAASTCAGASSGPNRVPEIFLRDTEANTTSRISRTGSGRRADGASSWPVVSGSGRYVAFVSEASDLVRGDGNGQADIFLHDTATGVTELVSRRPDGKAGNGPSRLPAIGWDADTIAFQSLASDLVCAKGCRRDEQDINLLWDVFLFDRSSGAMLRASADGSDEWMAPSHAPSIDGFARVLVFRSRHPINLEDGPNDADLFIWMRGALTPPIKR
jgi:Tol biopolymer transport system component